MSPRRHTHPKKDGYHATCYACELDVRDRVRERMPELVDGGGDDKAQTGDGRGEEANPAGGRVAPIGPPASHRAEGLNPSPPVRPYQRASDEAAGLPPTDYLTREHQRVLDLNWPEQWMVEDQAPTVTPRKAVSPGQQRIRKERERRKLRKGEAGEQV